MPADLFLTLVTCDLFFFFFQAEDGIRDLTVTGVQTCALPISNVGSDRDWTGSDFNQANWYAFGRLAWDHTLSAAVIADEWIRMTFSNDARVVGPVQGMMLVSRDAVVNYMTPLGLAHQMARGHHYGPGPWVTGGRADQTSVYFNRADSAGLGFDRTAAGSNAVRQIGRASCRERV